MYCVAVVKLESISSKKTRDMSGVQFGSNISNMSGASRIYGQSTYVYFGEVIKVAYTSRFVRVILAQ